MRSIFVSANSVEQVPVSWLWPNRIPHGAITIVEGDPGSNKSTLLYDIAARVSAGREIPNCKGAASPGDVLLISDEDAATTMRRTLEANKADLDLIRIYDKSRAADSPLRFPSDSHLLEYEIGRSKARLVVLDPITSFVEGSVNVDHSVRRAVGPLTAVAERTGSAIVFVRHLRKSGSGRSAISRHGQYRPNCGGSIESVGRNGSRQLRTSSGRSRQVKLGNIGIVAVVLSRAE